MKIEVKIDVTATSTERPAVPPAIRLFTNVFSFISCVIFVYTILNSVCVVVQ